MPGLNSVDHETETLKFGVRSKSELASVISTDQIEVSRINATVRSQCQNEVRI